MAIHVAKLALMRIDNLGNVMPGTYTIAQRLTSNLEVRVIDDPAIPNSSGSPTIEAYLALEDAGAYKFVHMDQTYLITQT